MSYKFRGQKVIINGEEQIIVPGTLPVSPSDGHLAVDQADGKLKIYNEAKSRWIVLGDAEDVVFNNSTNGYTSNNVQDAIEEGVIAAILKPRYSIVTTFNGTVGRNNWLGYSELIPGDEVPIRIPLSSTLKEITFAYRDTFLGSASIEGKFRLYKNGLSEPSNRILEVQFTNQNKGLLVTGLNIPLNPNDAIVGRWIDEGSNPSDMAIVYFFQVE